MRYELSAKNTLVVRGPASVICLAGQATILGCILAPSQRKIVERQKQLPIETERRATVEITLGKSATMFEIKASTIPASWTVAAAALERMEEGKVIILGQSDVGKSTLCVYLVNKLLQEHQNLRVIDADIGQADLGPPTTIAHAIPTQPIASLQEITPDRRLFIGHISPSGVKQKLVSGIQRLSAKGEKTLTIINTDGWIADLDAILYKIELLTQVSPNLVLGLAYSDELEPILGSVRFDSMKIDAAKDVLERSRIDRRSIRTDGYRRFLEGAFTHRVSFEKLQSTSPPHFPEISTLNREKLSNLILGILDKMGYMGEIGILTEIERDAVRIYSRYSGPLFKVELGHVKLSTSGREIGFL